MKNRNKIVKILATATIALGGIGVLSNINVIKTNTVQAISRKALEKHGVHMYKHPLVKSIWYPEAVKYEYNYKGHVVNSTAPGEMWQGASTLDYLYGWKTINGTKYYLNSDPKDNDYSHLWFEKTSDTKKATTPHSGQAIYTFTKQVTDYDPNTLKPEGHFKKGEVVLYTGTYTDGKDGHTYFVTQDGRAIKDDDFDYTEKKGIYGLMEPISGITGPYLTNYSIKHGTVRWSKHGKEINTVDKIYIK